MKQLSYKQLICTIMLALQMTAVPIPLGHQLGRPLQPSTISSGLTEASIQVFQSPVERTKISLPTILMYHWISRVERATILWV